MLATTTYPAAAATTQPDLLIVHGLYGSARNWGVIARHLAAGRTVHAVDMRNHGQSPRTATHSYADMAGDLAEVITHFGAPMDVLGHSMGGKAAMQLALTRPELIRKLVVADIAPVAYGHDQTQHITAMRALDLTGLTSRSEADRRLSATVADPALRAFFLQSLDLKAQPPVWRLNLDVLEAEMPQIVGWPGTTGQFDGAHAVPDRGAVALRQARIPRHHPQPVSRNRVSPNCPARATGCTPSARANLNKRCRFS